MSKPASVRKNILGRLSVFMRPHRVSLISLGLLRFILLLLGLASPFLFKILIDDVMINKQVGTLAWVCVGYVTIYVLETVVIFIRAQISNRAFGKILFDLRRRIFNNYLNIPLTSYQKYNSGDLKNRIDKDVDIFEKFFNQQLIEYIFNWLVVIVVGIILLVLNWKLALFGLLMVPLSFKMTKWLGKGVRQTSEAHRNLWGKYESWLRKSIQGWKEVKALTIEKNEARIFTNYWHRLSKLFFLKQLYTCGNATFISFKNFFVTRMNLYFLGGFLIINGELTIGALLVFMRYYDQFFASIGSINHLNLQLGGDIPAMDRVLEVATIQTTAKSSNKRRSDAFKGQIEFNNVNFKYENANNYALQDISLSIKPRERIAIVGRSGSGKSSFVKVLSGLYKPQSGNIKIDGVELDQINPALLHRMVGFVMQDSVLFNMTIKENLLLAKPSATGEEIEMVCKLAFIDEFIDGLPDKYNTNIGEKGTTLSGGQKQRLAIARVLLLNPKIVIFDEATSSLDHESESKIHQAIERISIDKTVIIIAHRLSSIYATDRVIVINQGKIVGDDHHKNLLGLNLVYDTLFRDQYDITHVS